MGPADRDPASPPPGVPPDALDGLYRGPLADFVSARERLAKELRAGSEREASAWVSGLRKPTAAAWIANQLAARHSEGVKRLLAAGEELRALQTAVPGGEQARDRLRAAAAAERNAVAELMDRARKIAEEEEAIGAAAVDRVGETLQAAVADADLGEALRLGRVTREQRASSFGLGVGEAAAAPAATETPPATKRGKGRRAQGAEKRARREAERRRAAAEKSLASAQRKLERERAAAERAREALSERERKLAEAERAVAAAERELKRAR